MTVKVIEVLAEYWEIRILILSYRNIKWFSHFLENHLTASQYLNRIIIWLQNSTPNHIPKRTETVHPYKSLHMNVHSGIVYNTQKELCPSIDKWIIKLYLDIGIWPWKEWTTNACCNTEKLLKYYAKWKQPVTVHIFCDSL